MRILSALILAAVAVGGVAAHEDGHEPLICDESSFAPALTAAGFSGLIDAPDALIGGEETTSLYFTVDLGPDAYAETSGTLSGDLSWTVATNDYDLSVNGVATEGYQPFDPPVESASSTVAHCAIVAVTAIDFLAPLNVEQLQLDVTLSRTN